ncbi:MAG: DUF1722 domain-containing protein [Pseudomonadales bacterium]|nr:DUF1722 domain-containing protein [Pseudomonadales bacterium]MCP5182935.1 DUF1722 domain-containing protein [Pseudomonadales bacterium]
MNEALPPRPQAPLRLAISECLTGAEVRYDGSGARSSFPHEALDGLFDFLPVCPEMGIGLTVPRPPIRLVGTTDDVRAVGVVDRGLDVTQALRDFGEATAQQLRSRGVSGYVFMKNSPSCGLYRVKVYGRSDAVAEDRSLPVRKGQGVYARAVVDTWPELPVEECGRLMDAVIRENFVTRVFAYAHWQALQAAGVTASRLVAFHSRYKYLLMAHSIEAYRNTGRLLADLSGDLPGIAARYVRELMRGLSRVATRGGHANVLSHLQGYLRRHLDPASRQELASLVEAYRRGEQPLLSVLTLLGHHLRRFPDTYVQSQVYLEPHPPMLALRRPL